MMLEPERQAMTLYTEPKKTFKKVFVDAKHKRWINVDEFGNKDTITLKNTEGKLVTRTCQYWSVFFNPSTRSTIEKCKISYNGRYYFVHKDTILEGSDRHKVNF